MSTAEELLNDAVDLAGWTKRKQVEVLLGFIESIGAEDELSSYLDECTEDDDTDDGDPFNPDDE